jgi:glutathione S-transferase
LDRKSADERTGGDVAGETLELLQFRLSHYNEKARWALDWKGAPHRRTDLLPGPHAPRILWLTGRTQTPVLRVDGRIVADSARILEELERLFPEPPLLPKEPSLRRRALEIESRFDSEVGPAVRRTLFRVLLAEPDYVCGLFSEGRPRAQRRLYRALFPVTRTLMGRSMQVGDAAVAEAEKEVERALDFVAREAGPGGQLVGDAFSVADLTAAALLAPAVSPDHPDMALPQPRPAGVEAFLARWAAHPGAEWVREQYRRHRPLRRASRT